LQRSVFKRPKDMYKAIKYNTKEQALAAYRKMQERKRKWVEETEKEFLELRKIVVS